MSAPERLDVTGLTVTHGAVRAVDSVSLTVHPGEVLVLLGESGSGKSTLARTVLGLPGRTARVTGSVALSGTRLPLGERALSDIRGRRIGYVPQDPDAALDPLRRIGAQLVEVLLRHRAADGRRAARRAVPGLLDAAGLTDPERAARSYPHELSGGQRQRAAIALALACGPGLLVADEPTTALDALVRARVLDLLTASGASVLLVTHDIAAARRVADRVAVMHAGRIVESGPVERLLTAPEHPHAAALVAAQPGGPR
ncbi:MULTISPECIES: ABC transporter ATP-binding protein [Streptomyces]|uniref:ABC transporter ATP-binding protein n=1 Tax=Streptomyces griseosporeus TaxID=1910 RepID=A0ABV3KZ88_STRGS|nr:ABC transporter ATP-binding protein [Streptomyces actuosus]